MYHIQNYQCYILVLYLTQNFPDVMGLIDKMTTEHKAELVQVGKKRDVCVCYYFSSMQVITMSCGMCFLKVTNKFIQNAQSYSEDNYEFQHN